MRTLARLATRGSGPDGKDTVDLILGVGMRDNTLKPDTIYEIREIMDDLVLKSPSRIGKSAAFRRTKVPRKGKRHIEELRDQQWGFCFPAVRALAKNETAEDADLRSKSPSALVADCAPSGASAETTGFSRWSVHSRSAPARLVLKPTPPETSGPVALNRL